MKVVKKFSRAFTLIELLVVVAIIGILTAVVMANFSGTKARSRDAKRISDLSQLQLAIGGYFDRCGDYPPSLATSTGNPASGTATDTNCPLGITLGTFIASIPNPPTGGPAYTYNYSAGKTTGGQALDYVLGTTLEGTPSNVSNLTYFPSNTTIVTYSPVLTCNATTAFCLGPK